MKRNSNTLFLQSPNATTPVALVDNQPDFSSFTEPTLGVLQRAWQDFLNSGEQLEVIPDPEIIPEPPTANWDNFNLQMMSDTRFNQVYSQCLNLAPIVANALPTALDQVTSKGTTLFTLIWNQLCSIGGATSEDRIAWANYGTQNNLPLDFIDVLRGNNA